MKNLRYSILILSYLLFFKNSAYSNDTTDFKNKWFIPDFATMQFAGNIGFLSAGLGYELFNNLLYSDIIYGYVPYSLAGTEIHIISQKNTFLLLNKKIKTYTISPLLGFATSFETGKNSSLILPAKYPKGEYATNAIHFTIFIGGRVHIDFNKQQIINGCDFYTELGTVDTFLWYKLSESEVKINDIFSVAVGVRLYF